jgi:hypothetical protein
VARQVHFFPGRAAEGFDGLKGLKLIIKSLHK